MLGTLELRLREETGGKRFDSLEVGGWYACGRSGEYVECWDLHDRSQVLPAPTDRNGGERRYSYISAGYFHVCGVRAGLDAEVDCWGVHNDPLRGRGVSPN